MSTLSIRIPDSIHDSLRKLSRDDNISINQFVASALAEKITALETEDYIVNRGLRGSRAKLAALLAKPAAERTAAETGQASIRAVQTLQQDIARGLAHRHECGRCRTRGRRSLQRSRCEDEQGEASVHGCGSLRPPPAGAMGICPCTR